MNLSDDKAKLESRKERYIRDSLPVRLGNLASNLARLKSFSQAPEMSDAAGRIMRESMRFIEWSAGDAALTVQIELIELQRQLARWQLELAEIWNDSWKRTSLAEQAGAWSEKVLERSGLLNP
jgi:hypothetical protein